MIKSKLEIMFIFTKYILKVFIFLFLFLLPIKGVLSDENPNPSLLINQTFKSEYLLGPGDEIYIEFEGLEVFTDSYSINPQGYLILPDLDPLLVSGKTVKEIELILIQKYKDIIYNPSIKISITTYRPVIVTLRGEVNVTGLYQLKYGLLEAKVDEIRVQKFKKQTLSNINKQVILKKSPRLFDLIAEANGITQNADLSNITVIRKNSKSNGGGKIKTTVDLLSLIKEGDQSQNIVLHDEDDIFVHKSKNLLIDQIIAVNKSNITPSKMTIFVNGNVSKPGPIILKQGSSLFEALAASGGKEPLSGNIEFIRLKRNNPPEKRLINLNSIDKIGSKKNPILLEGDILIVRKNVIGKIGSIINTYTSPFINVYGIYKVFE